MSAHPLTIGLNVDVLPGRDGGTAQSTMGLIHALGELQDGPERYTVIAESEAHAEWVSPVMGPNQRLVIRYPSRPARRGPLSVATGYARGLAHRLQKRLAGCPRHWPEVPISDGFYEGLGCDVLHFTTQKFTLCALPVVYNPHDLQHLHLPQFFTPSLLRWRETIYPAGCHFAQAVVVGSQWVKDDVVRQYRLNPDKVQVIPWAPPTEAYREPAAEHVAATLSHYGLTRPFALYPAVTWPHKNHLRLLDAIARLRDARGLTIRLVCTGHRYEPFWPQVEARVRELGLGEQVRFLGFVPTDDLRALYRLAEFLVLPTLFEADSCPIWEAWLEGLPIASSNVTALPEQVMDAGVLFNPHRVESIADALALMATDAATREELRSRGYRRLKDFDWRRTGKAYRAVYRRLAGQPLSEEDRWLLGWDWMREPHKTREPDSL